MNYYSFMLALAGFCLTPLNRQTNDSPDTEFSAEPAVREFSGPPVFPETVSDTDLLIVNRWETVKFPAPPNFSPLFYFTPFLLLTPMVTALPVDWDSVSGRAPKLREARGDETPVEWPPRRKEYRERNAVIADSRVVVERREVVAWRRHDVPPMSSTQVKFIRGRAVSV